jgi:hypothetical protein
MVGEAGLDGRDRTIHTRRCQVAGGQHPIWRAERERDERDGVDPEVEHGSASPCGVVQPRRAVRGEIPVVRGVDRDELAELARLQDLPHDVEPRREPRPHRLDTGDLGGAGGCDNLTRFGGVPRERLLDHHVLAGRDG